MTVRCKWLGIRCMPVRSSRCTNSHDYNNEECEMEWILIVRKTHKGIGRKQTCTANGVVKATMKWWRWHTKSILPIPALRLHQACTYRLRLVRPSLFHLPGIEELKAQIPNLSSYIYINTGCIRINPGLKLTVSFNYTIVLAPTLIRTSPAR